MLSRPSATGSLPGTGWPRKHAAPLWTHAFAASTPLGQNTPRKAAKAWHPPHLDIPFLICDCRRATSSVVKRFREGTRHYPRTGREYHHISENRRSTS